MSRFSWDDPWAPPPPMTTKEIRTSIRRHVAWRPLPVLGMIAELPVAGNSWTQSEHDAWFACFTKILDYAIPIVDPSGAPAKQEES